MDYEGYGLGLMKQPKDKRDFVFGDLLPPVAVDLPDTYIPNYPESMHFDQGKSNECCACSIAYIRQLQEMDIKEAGLSSTDKFSPSYVYVADRKATENFEGMYLRSGCRSIKNKGICMYDDFPDFYSYKVCMAHYKNNKTRLDPRAKNFRVSSYYAAYTDEQIMTGIYTTKAVIAGINVFADFYHPNKETGIVKFNSKQPNMGGHAIVLDGWKTIEGEKYWRVHNSWGTGWGYKGDCFISFSDFRKMMLDNAYVLVDDVHELKINEYRAKFQNTKLPTLSFTEKLKYYFGQFKQRMREEVYGKSRKE